jgi:hypothetical protein
MRRACNDFSILKDETKFYGISLGYDYCAEHEWGIDGIRRKLGIDKEYKKNIKSLE